MSDTIFMNCNTFVDQPDFHETYSHSSETFADREEGSPMSYENNSQGSELCKPSKKIRRKRNAYHKIDDKIRVKLLEAVQRGETLKSAARKHGINYSSAKSVLHTYRKEGRILKKATTERPFYGGEENGQGYDINSYPSQYPQQPYSGPQSYPEQQQ